MIHIPKIISFPLVVSEFSCTPALETCDYVILSKSQLKYISMCYIQIMTWNVQFNMFIS